MVINLRKCISRLSRWFFVEHVGWWYRHRHQKVGPTHSETWLLRYCCCCLPRNQPPPSEAPTGGSDIHPSAVGTHLSPGQLQCFKPPPSSTHNTRSIIHLGTHIKGVHIHKTKSKTRFSTNNCNVKCDAETYLLGSRQ